MFSFPTLLSVMFDGEGFGFVLFLICSFKPQLSGVLCVLPASLT